MSTTIPAAVLVPLLLLAQAPVDGTKAADAADERLEFMKESAKSYKFTIGGDRASELTLKPEPAFRLGKQGDGVYAFAAMTCWALKAEHKGRPVWSLRH